jgi:chitosanase
MTAASNSGEAEALGRCALDITQNANNSAYCGFIDVHNGGSSPSAHWAIDFALPPGVRVDFAQGASYTQNGTNVHLAAPAGTTVTIGPRETIHLTYCTANLPSPVARNIVATDPSCGSAASTPSEDAGSKPPPPPVDASHPPADSGKTTTSSASLTPLQRKKTDMLTSIWENGTTVIQYAFSRNLKDGRGYTSGRAGFCTGTGTALLVVQCFDAAVGTGNTNKMHKYLSALSALNDAFQQSGKNQGSTSTLDAIGDYPGDWAATANDAKVGPAFATCQDQIVDKLDYGPAVDAANKWGLTQALTIAALYDAEINHGTDGVASMVKQTNEDTNNGGQTMASAPLSLADESAWLQAFLARRLTTLNNDRNWSSTVDRAAQYEQMRRDADWDLGAQFETNAKAAQMFPNAGYKDSGYPDCIISSSGAVSGDAICTSPTGR